MYNNQISPSERKLKLCVLPTCKGKRYDLVHKFPMNNERAQQWIDLIDLPELKNLPIDKIRKRYFICSKHFRLQDYKNCESRSLNTTAYPRLFLRDDDQTSLVSIDEMRYENSGEMRPEEFEINLQEPTIELLSNTETLQKLQNITIPTTIESEIKLQVHYIAETDTPPLTKGPNILKKKANIVDEIVIQDPIRMQTVQKPLNVYSSLKQANKILPRIINTPTPLNAEPKKIITLKRNANYMIEPLCRKIIVNEAEVTKTYGNSSQNHQKAEKEDSDRLLVFQHQALKNPLKVCSFWLRDHCQCSMCYGDTSQRTNNLMDIPLDIEPKELKTENDSVLVTWPDGHESDYNILELYDQLNPKPKCAIDQFLWSSIEIAGSEFANVTLNDYLCNDDVAKEVVASLIKFGCAFIKNVPANLQSTEIAIRRLFPIQKTLFGEMWSFSDNKAHNDIAYTNEALLAHNDNTYFTDAAGLKILHCISRTGDGGESILVDGFNVFQKLRDQNKDAFEYLSQVCVPAEYIEDGYHFKHSAPVIIVDPTTNDPIQIRFNMNDRAFFNQLRQEEMLTFYKHYKALATEIQLEQNEWRFKLEPGTVCIVDNWRLLHGRTAYSGRRQMVGCYVARSEFLSVARRYGIIS